MKKILAVITGCFLMTACQTVDPQVMAKNTVVLVPGEDTWFPSEERYQGDEGKQTPFVFFLQGTGGGNKRAYSWSNWFKQQGVGSVIIDNAGIRNVKRLSGISSSRYASDVQSAIDLIKSKSNLDVSRYAVMGFSRGGTASLLASGSIKDGTTKPDFVFSLYPGNVGTCPNSFGDETSVHIFYGELDEFGSYGGTRSACERMANGNDNAEFHLLKDAHHGYDDSWTGKWRCCGQEFTSAPNAAATERTKEIILEAMKKRWNVNG